MTVNSITLLEPPVIPFPNELELISRTTNARHNLIYKPELLIKNNLHWNDSLAHELTEKIPTSLELFDVYQKFIQIALNRQLVEIELRKKLSIDMKNNQDIAHELLLNFDPGWADHFIQLNFWPFSDKTNSRPSETVLLTYARMLNPNNEPLLENLCSFRNSLFNFESIKNRFHFEESWRVGKV